VTLDAPQHLDFDTACLHCGKTLGGDDEVAALDLQRVGGTAYVRSLCAACAPYRDEHPADGRWIDPDDLLRELGWKAVPPA
jgi:hypothetical protein